MLSLVVNSNFGSGVFVNSIDLLLKYEVSIFNAIANPVREYNMRLIYKFHLFSIHYNK